LRLTPRAVASPVVKTPPQWVARPSRISDMGPEWSW
jgi:hypothetical protein